MSKYYRIAVLLAAVSLVFAAQAGVGRASGNSTPEGLGPVLAAPQNQSTLAQAEGLVFNDLNRDGLQSLRERGLRNVKVSLLNSSKAVVGTTVTDVNGAYRFKDLTPGSYHVAVTPPKGQVFSPQDQGENELVDSDADPNSGETQPVTLAAGENDLVWTVGLYSPTAVIRPEPGTVKPPPTDIDICKPGTVSLGGVSTLRVRQLATGYCLRAFLWRHAFAIGRIPDGAGSVLSAVTFLEVYYQDRFVYKYDVPGETDSIRVCYAVPLGKKAQIYFLDFYGPRFGERTGKPAWEPLPTTVQNGIACAVSQTSGAYALIGK